MHPPPSTRGSVTSIDAREKKMRKVLATWSLVSAFTVSCASSAPDDCAFRAQDGRCAVVASSTGALECRLEDADLCETVTAFVEHRQDDVVSSPLDQQRPQAGRDFTRVRAGRHVHVYVLRRQNRLLPLSEERELARWSARAGNAAPRG